MSRPTIILKVMSQLKVVIVSFCAASGIEFSKVSKPRVRYTRPWISSISAKTTNRGSCKEVQSYIRPPQLVSKEKEVKFFLSFLFNK